MYDTLHFYLTREKAGNINLPLISQTLSGFTEINKETETIYTGYLNQNFKVTISDHAIKFKGSLPKYFLNDNFNTLTRSDTQRALEQMSDELHLSVHLADLTRIDFARNFIMQFEPEIYYNYLGDCQHYQRLTQPHSLYYSNNLKQKLFYNKKLEGEAKKLVIPESWSNQNALRYEMRYTGRLPKQFNKAEVTTAMLSDEKFYMELFDRWHQEYQSINKLKNINFNLSNMSSPKDFMKQLQLKAIQDIGQENIMQVIEEMRAKNIFTNPEYYSRLKKDIRQLCKEPDLTEQSDLISELDQKIKNAKKYYR
ncbi:MAG: hypothetical protein E6R13_09560 [Spirochaetes bacterium]|nr:MAG: hypothetical protein E6R13_09560 [Spirochaetota bacterium]